MPAVALMVVTLQTLTLLCIMQPRTAKKAVLFVGEYDTDAERYGDSQCCSPAASPCRSSLAVIPLKISWTSLKPREQLIFCDSGQQNQLIIEHPSSYAFKERFQSILPTLQ